VDVDEDLIIQLPRVRIAMRGILGEFFVLYFLEQVFPSRECCLGPNVHLCVPKGWGLSEGFFGDRLDDRRWLGSEFQFSCNGWGGAFSCF
jgi:hypothetical protein